MSVCVVVIYMFVHCSGLHVCIVVTFVHFCDMCVHCNDMCVCILVTCVCIVVICVCIVVKCVY